MVAKKRERGLLLLSVAIAISAVVLTSSSGEAAGRKIRFITLHSFNGKDGVSPNCLLMDGKGNF